MAWTLQNDQSYLHSGTGRDVLMGSGTLGTLGAMFLRIANKSSNVKGVLCSDQSGENAWEAGIEGANCVIRKVVNGTPAAASASEAHSIGAATPFSMRVDLEGTIIKVFINGVLPAVVTYDISVDPLVAQSGYGFTSSVNNGLVLQAFRCPLIPNVLPALKVLVWVCNGDIWYATRDPATGIARAALAKSRALAGNVQISVTEAFQKLYLVDGLGRHQVFDATNNTVSDWEREGVTDPFYLVCAHQSRVAGVTTLNKQNVLHSAVNDPDDFNTGSDLPGAAYGLSQSDMPRIGEPIRAMFAATRTAMIFACARSFYVNSGDPALGGFEVSPIVKGIGGSGMNAMFLTPMGTIGAHTTDGLCVIVGGQMVRISAPILTDIIQLDRPLDNYIVSTVRDPNRYGALIFLTPKDTGPAVHIWYDELTGQYSPPSEAGGGGFWPESYPDNIGPTAACDWDGTIVLGGRDGYLRTFDDSHSNFDGIAIAWRLPVALVTSTDLNCDSIIQECTIVRGEDSGEFNVVFYGGRTAEEAISGETRTLLIRKQTTGRETILMPKVRAPAVVIEFSGLTYNVVGIVEAVQVVTTPGAVSRFARTAALSTAFGNSLVRGSRQNIGGVGGPTGGTSGPAGEDPGGEEPSDPTGTYNPGGSTGDDPFPGGEGEGSSSSSTTTTFDAGP